MTVLCLLKACQNLVYADDIYLTASNLLHLQALLDALALYCGTRISVMPRPKSWWALVHHCLQSPLLAMAQKYNNLNAFLGLQFHQSGAVSYMITSFEAKTAGSWALVQQHHAQIQCGDNVTFQLPLFQSILVAAIRYGCQVWGTHSPSAAAANKARLHLEQLYKKRSTWG